MSPRPPSNVSSEPPLRTRLVIGWSLFFVLVLGGVGYALLRGPGVPVLLDQVPK